MQQTSPLCLTIQARIGCKVLLDGQMLTCCRNGTRTTQPYSCRIAVPGVAGCIFCLRLCLMHFCVTECDSDSVACRRGCQVRAPLHAAAARLSRHQCISARVTVHI